jgi:hypothetical protein
MPASRRSLTITIAAAVAGFAAAISGAGCADDAPDLARSVSIAARDATQRPPTTTGTSPTAPAFEPAAPVPTGILVAVPQQNREDPAERQFQVQVVNGTDERFEVRSVQFVWDGFTSPVTSRDSTIVAGQTIDFPVPFTGARCAGDGDLESMPAIDRAVVLIGLDDGSVRRVPVLDRWHLARRLYLDDCDRQRIESLVGIEWADLHEAELDGRPVTAGELRLTRRAATGTLTLRSISGTIPYGVEPVTANAAGAVVVLTEGDDVASAPIRIVEGRCDPHALAEAKQPHMFVAQIDLGDGVLHPYVVVPPEAAWIAMRLRADEACVLTGKVEFVGDES